MSKTAEILQNEVIPYSAIKARMPNRNTFVNPEDKKAVDATIAAGEPLLFLPTYLMEDDKQTEKYIKGSYKIILMGVLKDGRRVNIVIEGINPYFEVLLPENEEEINAQIKAITDILNAGNGTAPTSKSKIAAKQFKYYHEAKSKFLRLYYTKTKDRTEAIKLVRSKGYTTVSDDMASYYRVVCRNYLTTFSSWVLLENYQRVTIDKLKGVTYKLDIKDYKPYTGELTADLMKDKTLSCCWDIETWSTDGDIPVPENSKDNIFCLSMTFQWVNDRDPFFKVCLCDYPAENKEGYLTIVCGNEKNIIRGFAEIFELMRPEFIFGFNDSDYDWNWVIKRAARYNGLLTYMANKMTSVVHFSQHTDASIFKYNFKKEHVKVEADTYVDGYALMMPGYIPVDVRTIFRKLYPTAEQSTLKWFLEKNKLGGKADMPYEEMFRIYREYRTFIELHGEECKDVLSGNSVDLSTARWSNAEVNLYQSLKKRLADINHYCVIDAQRCHDLMKIRSVTMDHREVSNLAFCSLYDAFYRANGMKVRNLTIAVGQGPGFNMRFSNIANDSAEDGKYPGGFVLPPRKGLKISKLSMEERIKKAELTREQSNPACAEWIGTTPEELSVYHKIVEDYGAIGTPELLDKIEKEQKTKLPKKFKEFWLEPIGRPITGLDFSSLYPSLIRAYNFSPEYCILDKKKAKEISDKGQKVTKVDFDFHGKRKLAYFVWHNNKYNLNEPGFQFGVYPYILDDLFKKRALLKKQMKKFDHRKEEIEAMSMNDQELFAKEYEEVVFNKNYLNSKQNALKVFMNTFYGEAGNKRSPFFVMEVAGGVTTYGQKNIKFAYAFVKEKECNVYYGDSVAEYTPVLIRRRNTERLCEISNIARDADFVDYNGGKQIATLPGLEIWSDSGWTPVKHVIRHITDKKMFRVTTGSSIIDVTEDHSLLLSDGTPLKPGDCLGKELLTKELPVHFGSSKLISKGLAWIYGVFFANGLFEEKQDNVSRWTIVFNRKDNLLAKTKRLLEVEFPEIEWEDNRIFPDDPAWHKYDAFGFANCNSDNELTDNQLTSNSDNCKYILKCKYYGVGLKPIDELDEKWESIMYYNTGIKIVPDCVVNSDHEIQETFMRGMLEATWCNSDCKSPRTDCTVFATSQLTVQTLSCMCRNLGYTIDDIYDMSKEYDQLYRLTISTYDLGAQNIVVSCVELPPGERVVYDLETESHHFSAGVGDLVVHNTDSLYLSTPEKHFAAADIEYYSGKETKLNYWTKLVETTFREINPIKDGVNKAFIEDNGTQFLSMAYEEVLAPVAFTAKKKYFGIAHENIPNFKPKDLFVRGLEVKKRGVSDLLRKIFTEIMWTVCDPNNVYDLTELVLMKIDEIYKRTWKPQDFVQSGVYRPSKNNVKIQTFVKNMKERNIIIKPNERFGYVTVKKYPYTYDLRGRKVELSIGDRLELAEEVEKHKDMEIDLDYYMQSSINGQLARLITYHDMFKVEPADTTDEELKIAEDRIYKNACKFIESYCQKYYTNYNTFGKTHQKIYKTANKSLTKIIKSKDTLMGDLLGANVDYDDFETWFTEYTEKKATKLVGDYGRQFIDEELNKVSTLVNQNYDTSGLEGSELKEALKAEIKSRCQEKLTMMQASYYGSRKSILDQRELNYRNTMTILRKKLRENHSRYMEAYSKYNLSIKDLIELMRGKIEGLSALLMPTVESRDYKLEDFGVDIDEDTISSVAKEKVVALMADEKFRKTMNDLRILHNDMLAAHLLIHRTRDLVSQLKMRRDHANRAVVRPDDSIIRQIIKEDIADMRSEIRNLDI